MKRAISVFLLTLLCGFANVQVAFAQETRKFLLDGTAQVASDPNPIPKLNPFNDVIRTSLVESPPGSGNFTFANVSRSLGVKIEDLTDELEAKWYFPPPPSTRTCGAGAPRITLAVDLDGDGIADGNAFGYFGPPPNFTGCAQGKWTYEDLTDGLPRWDLSQLKAKGLILPPGFVLPWSVIVSALDVQFPNHLVCTGSLDDDKGGVQSGTGDAFYDIIGIGFDTLENRTDVGGRGFAQGCKPPDDDEGEGDDNSDDRMKFQDSASQPQNSSMAYSDPSAGLNLQGVNGVNSIAYKGACVSFAGDALVNGNPGFLFTFAACDLSALGTGIGNFSMTVTGPLGFLYQKAAPITSGFVFIHPH